MRFLFFILIMTEKGASEWKGYLWALAGTIAFSSLYVFSKASLSLVDLAQFGLYYFGIGFVLNLIWIVVSGKAKELLQISPKLFRLLVILASIDLASNITFFLSVHAIPDPAVTSFLGNLFPVFLTLLGIFFLKERFSKVEAIGGIIAISGAFVISYNGEMSLQNFFIPGTGLVVLNTFLAATFSAIVKKNVHRASPEIFNLNSNFWIFLAFAGYFIQSGQSFAIPAEALSNIALGAFFGAFFGLLSFYYSYRYIAASRSSVVQSLKGIFVLIISWFYLQKFPLVIQLVGGGISVAGVLLMTMSQAGLFRKQSRSKFIPEN